MSDCFLHTIINRRSIYGLGRDITLKKDILIGKIEAVAKMVPSAFNGQSARVVILLDNHHKRLWEIVSQTLQAIVPAEKFAATEQKISAFSEAYGTLLYFIDTQTVANQQEKFPLYQEKFPVWAEQENGMVQFALWSMLSENLIGANLQHYNPLIDDAVKKEWNLPADWQLTAQMPFGNIKQPPAEKTFIPLEEKVRVFV